MSTRLHELAKELGLKSKELIDRIQKEGLEVKPTPLASVDEAMADRIRHLASGGKPAERSTRPAPARPNAPESPPIPTTAPAPKAAAPAPSKAPETTAGHAPPRREPPSQPPAPPAGERTAPSTSEAANPQAETTPADSPSHRQGLAGAPRGGPLASHTRSAPVGRSGSGPLSSHTPHRVAGPGSGGGPRGAQGGGPGDGPRPNPSSPPPLKRSDYISPTGTRGPAGGRPVAPTGPGQGPVRRPGDSFRREGPLGPRGGRPLPPVASPGGGSAPVSRRPDSPRPAPGPEGKVQRPEVRYTPAQLREMMLSGQIGNAAPPAPGDMTKPGLAARRPPGPPGGTPLSPTAPTEEGDDRKGRGRLGGVADRAGRREQRSKRAQERRVGGAPGTALLDQDDDGRRRGPRRGGGRRGSARQAAPRKTHAVMEPPITVRTLSEAIGVKANEILRKLMNTVGLGVTINSSLDEESALELAMEFGVELEIERQQTAEEEMLDILDDEAEVDQEALRPRPPVITILGHVDHGKTSLLDKIRKANVVASESGGITQHIGAYQITHNDQKITFVDTPGHEAFTAMRARGANVTDIVVLVVAADDGLMPQTVEAIAHAKAAEVPVVVALNKIDLPNVETQANITKIFGELAQQGLNPSEWGGETDVIKTSTLTGRGIDDLLSTLEILAETLELKANPDRPATGTCLEASISEGRGVVASVLVREGTLKVGDVVACGDSYGRVRALYNDLGRTIDEAPPSTPVEISGLDSVPEAGEKFAVLDEIARARDVAEVRRSRVRSAGSDRQALTLENVFNRMAEQKVNYLNLIIKTDVQGSLEAIVKELEKLKNDEVPIRILHKAVGGIVDSDIMLAEASDAIVVGFRVAPEDRALSLADEKKIDIRRYDIIYQVTDEIKKAVEGLLIPETKETILGAAVVRQVFKITKVGTVAGCYVTRGVVERGAKVRLYRDQTEIYKGAIDSLKRHRDEVKEVREGFECGIKITNYDDIKVDDVIEIFKLEVIRRTL